MKTSKTIAALIAVAVLVLPSGRARAAILWGPATTVAGDADVRTNGSLVVAYSLGDTSIGSKTVNGVTFVNSSGAGAGLTTDSNTANAFGSGSAPFASLSASYQDLLNDATYITIPSTTSPFTLTLSGLTIGRQYEFQWWTQDARASRVGWTTTATDGGSVALNPNVGGVNGGLGRFAIGAFTAASGSEIITFVGSNVGQINAYQLRDVTIPEPSAVGLLAVGALMVWRRKKMA